MHPRREGEMSTGVVSARVETMRIRKHIRISVGRADEHNGPGAGLHPMPEHLHVFADDPQRHRDWAFAAKHLFHRSRDMFVGLLERAPLFWPVDEKVQHVADHADAGAETGDKHELARCEQLTVGKTDPVFSRCYQRTEDVVTRTA